MFERVAGGLACCVVRRIQPEGGEIDEVDRV